MASQRANGPLPEDASETPVSDLSSGSAGTGGVGNSVVPSATRTLNGKTPVVVVPPEAQGPLNPYIPGKKVKVMVVLASGNTDCVGWKPHGSRSVLIPSGKEIKKIDPNLSGAGPFCPGSKPPRREFWLRGRPFRRRREPKSLRTCYIGIFFCAVDFSGLDLSGFDFTGCTFMGCKFHRCNLKFSQFDNSHFHNTEFSQSLIEIVTFTNCFFRFTHFNSQYFECVDFSGSTIESCDFTFCIIETSLFNRVNWDSVKFLSCVKIFDSQFKKCEFHEGEMEQLLVVESDFSGATFNGTKICTHLVFRSTLFFRATFNDIELFGLEFCRGIFQVCNFMDATFGIGSSLTDIDFIDCDFSSSIWDFITLRNISFQFCGFGSSKFYDMYIKNCSIKYYELAEFQVRKGEDFTIGWVLPKYCQCRYIPPPIYGEEIAHLGDPAPNYGEEVDHSGDPDDPDDPDDEGSDQTTGFGPDDWNDLGPDDWNDLYMAYTGEHGEQPADSGSIEPGLDQGNEIHPISISEEESRYWDRMNRDHIEEYHRQPDDRSSQPEEYVPPHMRNRERYIPTTDNSSSRYP